MKEIRVGIVGMGPRGRGWLNTFRLVKGVKVAAICERIEPLLKRALAEASQPDIEEYRDFSRMLDGAELNAVVVVVEPHNNADLVCTALLSGHHVLCEVPLAFTLRDCWRIVLAAENAAERGVLFGMAEQLRYSAYVLAWRRMVEKGELGRVLFAEGQYLHGRTDERYWLDSATGRRLTWDEARDNPAAKKSRCWYMAHPIFYLPHELSPVLKVLDDRVERVTCMGTRPRSYLREEFPVPDMEVALMRTEKDAILRMACGFAAPTPVPHHWHHILGTAGSVETGRSQTDSMKVWLAASGEKTKTDTEWEYGKSLPNEAVGSGHGNLDYFPAADFIHAIRNRRTPELDIYKSVETAAPAIAAGISAENGGAPVTVPDFRPNRERPAGQPQPPSQGSR